MAASSRSSPSYASIRLSSSSEKVRLPLKWNSVLGPAFTGSITTAPPSTVWTSGGLTRAR
jgi:hypothetical protein